ncbi:MAG: hypothetical protein IPP64_07365 [Bacteroidetes bacterium]|nr:hypothetical protein [Bacteroidota bacterium]
MKKYLFYFIILHFCFALTICGIYSNDAYLITNHELKSSCTYSFYLSTGDNLQTYYQTLKENRKPVDDKLVFGIKI